VAAWTRDPVSELFDAGARRLLTRAYARVGTWQQTRVTDPSARHCAWAAELGIDLDGRDKWGRPRWAAGMVRAIYYQHKWFYSRGALREQRRNVANDSRAVQVEVGRRMPAVGVLPAGRIVRVRVRPGGAAAARAARAEPADRRIYTTSGAPGARWNDQSQRDW
jgi:hypothetical protein